MASMKCNVSRVILMTGTPIYGMLDVPDMITHANNSEQRMTSQCMKSITLTNHWGWKDKVKEGKANQSLHYYRYNNNMEHLHGIGFDFMSIPVRILNYGLNTPRKFLIDIADKYSRLPFPENTLYTSTNNNIGYTYRIHSKGRTAISKTIQTSLFTRYNPGKYVSLGDYERTYSNDHDVFSPATNRSEIIDHIGFGMKIYKDKMDVVAKFAKKTKKNIISINYTAEERIELLKDSGKEWEEILIAADTYLNINRELIQLSATNVYKIPQRVAKRIRELLGTCYIDSTIMGKVHSIDPADLRELIDFATTYIYKEPINQLATRVISKFIATKKDSYPKSMISYYTATSAERIRFVYYGHLTANTHEIMTHSAIEMIDIHSIRQNDNTIIRAEGNIYYEDSKLVILWFIWPTQIDNNMKTYRDAINARLDFTFQKDRRSRVGKVCIIANYIHNNLVRVLDSEDEYQQRTYSVEMKDFDKTQIMGVIKYTGTRMELNCSMPIDHRMYKYEDDLERLTTLVRTGTLDSVRNLIRRSNSKYPINAWRKLVLDTLSVFLPQIMHYTKEVTINHTVRSNQKTKIKILETVIDGLENKPAFQYALVSSIRRMDSNSYRYEFTTEKAMIMSRVYDNVLIEKHLHVDKQHRLHALVKLILREKNLPMLVFTKKPKAAKYLAKILTEIPELNGIEIVPITADTKTGTERHRIEAMQTERMVIVTTTGVLQRGFNLGLARSTVIYETIPSAATVIQSIGRIERPDASDDIRAYIFEDNMPWSKQISSGPKYNDEFACDATETMGLILAIQKRIDSTVDISPTKCLDFSTKCGILIKSYAKILQSTMESTLYSLKLNNKEAPKCQKKKKVKNLKPE